MATGAGLGLFKGRASVDAWGRELHLNNAHFRVFVPRPSGTALTRHGGGKSAAVTGQHQGEFLMAAGNGQQGRLI